jgi:mono/diheme cytochrome c family protein
MIIAVKNDDHYNLQLIKCRFWNFQFSISFVIFVALQQNITNTIIPNKKIFLFFVFAYLCNIYTASAVEPDLLTSFRKDVMRDVSQIVFAVRADDIDGYNHWYTNFGYYADDENSVPDPYAGGKLCVYDLNTQKLATLIDDPQGSVRDPQVNYEATKILFSYRKGDSKFYHLYEINMDGSGLHPLTDGDFDDIEPTYIADGSIVFVSTRAKRWVNCWIVQVAILYGCDADGNNIHPLSGNIEQDNSPCPLPDGRIIYTRWEYIDRSQVDYHHLWTMNPDGTKQMVYFGNLHPGTLYIDARPIPESNKIVCSVSPGHGLIQHQGYIGIIDPKNGPDDKTSVRKITKNRHYRDPWAFSENAFLAADKASMVVLDDKENEQIIFELPKEWTDAKMRLQEPRPIIQRPREAMIPSTVKPAEETGKLMLVDVYQGRNMAGVKRGDIKKLLILESLPKPVNFTGGMEPLSYGGTFTLERIFGTVPVDPDGSAYFELPALRSFFFIALDKDDRAVKRMQSFHSVMPGELTSCVGCHENRNTAPRLADNKTAFKRPPVQAIPIADIPDVIDFPRDIQPILDARCVQCHSPQKRSGGVSLVGHHTPIYSISYYTITAKSLVADGRNLTKSNYPPYALGSGSSRILEFCNGGHHEVQLTDKEKLLMRYWVETGAPYPGTYAALGCGMIGGYARNQLDQSDRKWKEVAAMTKVLQQNCTSCHTKEKNNQLPLSASDEIGGQPWITLKPNDVRRKYSRQLLYDLSEPELSVLLLAPLAKSEGGYESCGSAILKNKKDPRYKTILAGIERTKNQLDSIKRFDMSGFVPRPQYIRELKKYGIIPSEQDVSQEIDMYAAEQKYWQSLWYGYNNK